MPRTPVTSRRDSSGFSRSSGMSSHRNQVHPPTSRDTLASRDGRYDHQLIAVRDRRLEPPGEPNVLVVEVNRDKRVRIPFPVREAGAELGVAGGDVGDDVADRGARRVEGAPAPGQRRQDARQLKGDGHGLPHTLTDRLRLDARVTWYPAAGRRISNVSAATPAARHARVMARATAAARARDATATMAEPEPESVAPKAPAARAARTTAT